MDSLLTMLEPYYDVVAQYAQPLEPLLTPLTPYLQELDWKRGVVTLLIVVYTTTLLAAASTKPLKPVVLSEERLKSLKGRSKSVPTSPGDSLFYRFCGGIGATIFSSVYVFAPLWLWSSLYLAVRYPFDHTTWIVVAPVVISAVLPPIPSRTFLARFPFRYISSYFHYEEVMETSAEELRDYMKKRHVLFCVQPHGVFSFGGACSGVEWVKRWWDPNTCPTAVASVLVRTPILKHIMGIFGIVDASSKTLSKQLKKAHAVLYIGGIAELFLSSPTEEKLFAKSRKGFIKLALRTGADIFPIYFLGNTESLRVGTGAWIRKFARVTGMSLTPLWGKWFTLVPVPTKIVGVLGKPLNLPHIEEPTQEDVDKYHALYISEVRRLFETYKDLSPTYANKTLSFE